ncbi:MAG TPA: acyl-CoA dehydrogenase family protein [Terrimicrobiaceae bacterium]
MPKPDSEFSFDTSRMSEGERAALETTEAAREAAAMERTFAGGLFLGRCNLSQIMPFPDQTTEDRDQGDAFLCRLEEFLRQNTDPDEIDQSGEIPDAVIEGLARLGAFGIKIPVKYGGLGLSQANYCRAAMLLGSWCGNMTALLSAHQSIGVPQPLLMFGTEQQRQKYLPRLARGEISAFALTEPGVGSDPARMETHAEPSADGSTFILNGCKMWCTNGTRAGVVVVMAKTPPKVSQNQKRSPITAFIVETAWPGVEVIQRCHFMGLRALYNAVIEFRDVRVPRENILFAEGKGLRVALSTLNTGRLTLPAACVGLAKRCLEISTRWAKERVQWGRPIGEHAAIAHKIAEMAAETFAMESMTMLTASLVDGAKSDVRLESAICKMLATEWAWKIANDTMQIRGGRGYETAASLAKRGESPDPVERIVRDSRINTIFEGSSEIMRLFIAREALDPHLKISGPLLDRRLSLSQRAAAGLRATRFYGRWYPSTYLPQEEVKSFDPRLAGYVRWCRATARLLARRMFHQMIAYGPALEKRQLLLSRFVDAGAELFAVSAVLARVQTMIEHSDPEVSATVEVANYFCRGAQFRVADWFRSIRRNADNESYRLAKNLLARVPKNLSEGILRQSRDVRDNLSPENVVG